MNISLFTPFIRYALIAAAAHLVSRGLLTAEQADSFANDPAVIEMMAGIVTAIGTLAWYLYSTSRQALKDRLG